MTQRDGVQALDPLEQRPLGEEDPRAGVVEGVAQVLVGRGEVEREGHGTQVQGRGVPDVELGTVADQQRHRVTGLDPEAGQACGETTHPVGVLPPGDVDVAAERLQRDRLRRPGRHPLEVLRQRRRVVRG